MEEKDLHPTWIIMLGGLLVAVVFTNFVPQWNRYLGFLYLGIAVGMYIQDWYENQLEARQSDSSKD